ncbi:glycosyl transferase family 2 [Pseudopedobacter saltans DSM 12145]|uniref:Glycosyl transferase family 2 n=1 Tax=Pseudopedobacter saltans (strain ATCC 51119 / DSM 12145 / JCM 21818 / CCUG 39354 / LMG 10337 / NBRC 100064 / NCIMB 13643) TaxID=762903 RepID=F0S7T1_PSESL|nr:glycosyltransferase family 2 protein [Pseudopedobacter saltans]ADY53336.1 glycosyl transferase family 2 [Pseudopedobacter saltans DSM 12145]
MKSISVIIPNYNGRELLSEILPYTEKALETIPEHEIIIVDDCSSDDSVTFIQQNHPHILLLQNEKNSGFSSTVNRGLKAASKDLVFILNSDAKIFPDYFIHQLPYFDSDETFGVNGMIINWDNDEKQSGGKLLRFNALKIISNINYYLTAADEHVWYKTMFLSGTNILLDRKKALQINGLDELFDPFYVEDIELSLRALRMGWKLYYEPKSICRHHISKTIQSYHKRNFIQYLNIRNKFFMHCIHLSVPQLIGWFFLTITTSFLRIFIGNVNYLKAFFAFMKNYKGVIKSRNSFHNIANSFLGKNNLRPTKAVLKELSEEIAQYPIKKEFY